MFWTEDGEVILLEETALKRKEQIIIIITDSN